jgi:hypothetical protein
MYIPWRVRRSTVWYEKVLLCLRMVVVAEGLSLLVLRLGSRWYSIEVLKCKAIFVYGQRKTCHVDRITSIFYG